MGLDISAGPHDFHVGSYGGVHMVRLAMFRAFLGWLKKHAPDAVANFKEATGIGDGVVKLPDYAVFQASSAYRHTFEVLPDAEQDDGFSDNVELLDADRFEAKLIWAGIGWFIDHSDCEGHLTPGQAADLLFAIQQLRPHLAQELGTQGWTTPEEYIKKFEELLAYAVEAENFVQYH